jgi:hypothetical protein
MIMLSWITKIKLRTNGIWGHVRYTAAVQAPIHPLAIKIWSPPSSKLGEQILVHTEIPLFSSCSPVKDSTSSSSIDSLWADSLLPCSGNIKMVSEASLLMLLFAGSRWHGWSRFSTKLVSHQLHVHSSSMNTSMVRTAGLILFYILTSVLTSC